MIEEFFNDYTAGEFLDWLIDENLDEYVKEVIEENDGEAFVANMFDVEKLKKNFLYHIRRYTVIKRGFKFYIHDERQCMDIMMFRYTDSNKEEIQNHVNDICNDLNSGKVIFTGRKHHMCG